MKKGEKRKLIGVFWMLALTVLSLVLLPAVGRAASPCPSTATTDNDKDGFTEAQECNGLPMANNQPVYTGYILGISSGMPRNQYLDPAGKDLFVIMIKQSSTLIPQNSTATVGGLGITSHEITSQQAFNSTTRQVSSASSQLAMKITEDQTTDYFTTDNRGRKTYLAHGASFWGTPNGQDDATVYTKRIDRYVREVACLNLGNTQCLVVKCTTANCTDAPVPNTTIADVVTTYISNTIPHEMGHMMKLSSSYSKANGGYHYVTGSNTVMEQSLVYKRNTTTGVVTYYIPINFAGIDATSATLIGQ